MTAFMPRWRQFDAQAARVLSLTSGRGRVVLLGMTPEFLSGPEAVRLAISVGRNWAASGVLVVLADGCFDDPRLHVTLHLPNDGGLADVLFLDSPLREMVQPGGRRGFHVLTTGISGDDALPKVEHKRWERLKETIHDEGVTFALFAPLESDFAQQALAACTDIVVLANSDNEVEDLLAPGEERVREVIGPEWRRPHRDASFQAAATGRTPGPGSTQISGLAPAAVARQILELFEAEPPPPFLDPNRRRRSGRDRRVLPDRRNRLWAEAADSVRRGGELPPGVLTDRRAGSARRDRRAGSDRRSDGPRVRSPPPPPLAPEPVLRRPVAAAKPEPMLTLHAGVPPAPRLRSRDSGRVLWIVFFVTLVVVYAVLLWPIG